MAGIAKGQIEAVTEDIVRFDAAMSLHDLYAKIGDRALLVEPLSARKPLADFLAESGIGYGALSEGSFAASICRIKTDLIEYGSNYQALYNAGYPLQRMAEGQGSALTEPLGTAQELTVYVRPQDEPVAVYEAIEQFPAEAPGNASDFLVVNDAAAALLGLPASGAVALYPREVAPVEGDVIKRFWEKRFIEDALEEKSLAPVKFLAQRSAAKVAYEMAREADCVFFALFAYNGVLILLAGASEAVQLIEEYLAGQALAWKLGEAVASPADDHHGH